MEPQHSKPIFKLLIILLIIIFLSVGGYLLINGLPKKSSKQIEIASEIPNFSVVMQNESSLTNILKSWSIFTDKDVTYLTLNGKQTNKIKTIKITLSGTNQKLGPTYNKNDVTQLVTSYNTIEYKDGLEIIIYLNKTYLLAITDKQERERQAQRLILRQLYKIFNIQTINDDRLKSIEESENMIKQTDLQPLIFKFNLQ